ncbi:endolytic transglycosylase MltG [Patescibacteria group bacterium]|nr:endolytic transglycosylase MltG [Patescibacteria group bacterium]
MSKKRIILGYLIFAVIVIILYFSFQNFSPGVSVIDEQDVEAITILVEKGEGLKEIGQKLKDQGLIKNIKTFEIYAFLSRAKNKFWPGEYKVEIGMGLKDLVKSLISSPLAQEKEVTFIEGWTNKEVEKFLKKQEIISEEEFLLALNTISQNQEILDKYEFLSEAVEKSSKEAMLQGYLFPDTYRFYKETTAEAIIKKTLENFDEKIGIELRQRAEQAGRNIFEIVTMASLIEKEAALDQDRRLIADIFWKRLKVGWALESCATINYILGVPKARLSFEDTRIPSPYNTYLNAGLPPGPINNPGLSSIKAALDPLENDYCCFLSTDQGEMIFSQTIEEHNRNKNLYLK